jgi:hypothetical protein
MVLNAKGDLSKSLDKMKALLKVETAVQTDYHGFIYQMKAYTALIEVITGDESLISVQLENLVRSIEKYASHYKIEIAQDICFAGKFANVVDSRFYIFLHDCRKSLDREDINNRIVDFGSLHKDILLQKFNVKSLPARFTLVDDGKATTGKDMKMPGKQDDNNSAKTGRGKKIGGKDGDENKGSKKRSGAIDNKDHLLSSK